ncbi:MULTISPECIES: HNH endonuclease [Streptomyces]|uniref:HNH endonuclease n=1 Tax=Streptomyces TaxID=1883 RepID=UPI000FD6909D|nr:HNH endonuclease signature motif containing protein [Streptomyces sp. B29(2018)]
MPEGRPAIPAELERRVLVEAGHRCAIPTCRQHPVDIEHIDDWARVKKHEFENLIALCPTCHRRKGNRPGQIDRKSLRQYKANLLLLNNRYIDIERQLLDSFADEDARESMTIFTGMQWMLANLIRDGMVELADVPPTWRALGEGKIGTSTVTLTESGKELVDRLKNAREID